MRVGFIGLGRMGEHMARHIQAGGHSLSVYDVRPEACDALAETGARRCNGPGAVAAASEIVLTSLPGPTEVAAVLAGAGGVLEAVAGDAIVIDTSTIGPGQSRELAAAFAEKGAFYLDAPVSGAQEGARAGTLTVMVGGDAAAFARTRPVLECFGSNIRHLGPSGAGNGMKLVIQLIFMSYVATFFEGVGLGERLGIPLDTILDVLETSSAGRPDLTKRFDAIRSEDLTPRFEVTSALKDLTLAGAACELEGYGAEIVSAAAAAFRRTAELGLGDKDLISLRRMYSDLD